MRFSFVHCTLSLCTLFVQSLARTANERCSLQAVSELREGGVGKQKERGGLVIQTFSIQQEIKYSNPINTLIVVETSCVIP